MRHLFSLLFILSLSCLTVFADDESVNNACPGELISEMHLITTDDNHEEGPGTLSKNGEAVDYYTFQINADGTLGFYLSSNNGINVEIGTAACDSNPELLSDSESGSVDININNGDTVSIRLERDKNDDITYGFDLVFKEAVFPTAVEDNINTWVDTPVDIDVTLNDTDDGSIDKTSVNITSGVSNGSTIVNGTTGVVTYTPNAGFSGVDSFSYEVDDNLGNTSNIITVVILVKVPALDAENCDTGTENAYRDFCLRKQTMLPGNMLTIGNTILVAPNSDSSDDSNPSADCTTYTDGAFIDDATNANNSYNLCAYHEGGAGQPANTSATVTFPDVNNSEIEWAGLYWQALVDDSVTLTGHSIRFKNGTGTWAADGVSVTPDKLNWLASGFSSTNAYSAFKDVTSIMIANGWKDGDFSVADIPVREGNVASLGTFGAWSLVIIYRNGAESIRSFSVFDGWQGVSTGGNDNVPVALAGFYTPKSGDINASVSVFAAEGDKHITGDTMTVEDQTNGNAEVTLTNVAGNTFHSGVYGVQSRTPSPTNNQGIDIHTYPLGNVNGGVDVLNHEQTDITFRFKTTGDFYWPSMLAFTTEVYTPSFCYDYAYQQNGVFITEENNDTLRDPRITGLVTNGDDLNVTLYIRNREDSDVTARNLELNILDLNTTQAVYQRETVSILNADEVVALPVADSLLTVSDSYIRGIDYADVAGEQWIYTYFTLTPNLPTGLNNDINISLNVEFNYDLELITPTGSIITIPSTSTAGGTNLPLCSAGNFEFIKKEAWGIFNVVDTDIYQAGVSSGNQHYNIPTQVVRRVGNFSVVAYDSNSSNANNTETPDTNSSTLVGIDMIDAGAFHDILATCSEATSGISPILWMWFDQSSTIDLKAEIAAGIADDRLTINSVDEYFPNAVQSAAFRMHYVTTNAGDEDLVQTEDAGGGNVKLLNFTELVQDIGTCKQPVKKFANSDLTTIQVPVACGNAGNAGLSPFELQRCMACLFGYNTTHVCSRDNFSIRPESFNIKINDTNQVFPATGTRLEDSVTGVAAPSGAILDIAAGYNYNFEVNATSHVGNESTPGYSRYFDPLFPSDFNATLIWEPTNAAVTPFCNDANHTSLPLNMINGEIDQLGKHSNVGEYRFNIVDKGWTKVDSDINSDGMKHHRDNPTYYKGGATGIDCDDTSSAIRPNASMATDASGAVLANLNGCTIDSNNHDNDDASIKYRDYDMVLHPYTFNMGSIDLYKGTTNNVVVDANTSTYVYMNNILDDANMSVRYSGFVRAFGADDKQLNNFVSNCYAQDVSLQIEHGVVGLTPALNLRLFAVNENLIPIYDVNMTAPAGSTTNTLGLTAANFVKDLNGSSNMELNFNLTRTVNTATNPITIWYDDLNATCVTPGNCDSNADMSNTFVPTGELESNTTITHIYGRVHTPRQRVANPNPNNAINTNIPLYHEFYCDSATGCNITDYDTNTFPEVLLSQNGLLSQDDVRWYVQTSHSTVNDGNTTSTQARNALDNAQITTRIINPDANSANYTYSGDAYPYKTTINLIAPNWLIYNRYDAAATVNNFELEFYTTGRWAGEDQSGVNVDSNTSINVNRRIQW